VGATHALAGERRPGGGGAHTCSGLVDALGACQVQKSELGEGAGWGSVAMGPGGHEADRHLKNRGGRTGDHHRHTAQKGMRAAIRKRRRRCHQQIRWWLRRGGGAEWGFQ
jgi:hypothetical protein